MKPRLNRKSRWRLIRKKRIRGCANMRNKWTKDYLDAKEGKPVRFPTSIMNMMRKRVVYWLGQQADAVMNKQTPIKKGW